MKQSCTVFMWFFILSGRENSLPQTGHGNTLRWQPSWYKNACRWKLYLFLNVFTMSVLAHSRHLYTPSSMHAYRNKFSPRTDISVNCSAGSLLEVARRLTLRRVGAGFAGGVPEKQSPPAGVDVPEALLCGDNRCGGGENFISLFSMKCGDVLFNRKLLLLFRLLLLLLLFSESFFELEPPGESLRKCAISSDFGTKRSSGSSANKQTLPKLATTKTSAVL